jgi:hypothetical protein
VIRESVAAINNNKSIWTDSIYWEIQKMFGEDLIPYRERLIDIIMNNFILPIDYKRTILVLVHMGSYRSLVTNCRPISLTSMVCKQMEQVIASYLWIIWDKNDWLYEVNMD